MKYIIFGITSDKIPTKISLSKADLVTVNLEVALQRFEDACKSFKYKHLYLICDFEPSKHLKYAPYYIMQESHLGFNASTIYNKYSYIVENAGFTHIFTDPLKAFKEFMGYVNNDEYVRLSETTEGYDNKDSSIFYGSTKKSNIIVADTTLAKNPSKRLILFYNKKYDIGNGLQPNLHYSVSLS